MKNFEKVKQFIEARAAYYSEKADEAQEANTDLHSNMARAMMRSAANSHRQKAKALFEIINYINNIGE
jgi:hypothetical protein